ncbi:helix-turn-helix domain-containing protein [Bacteroides xylanisolvens]|uniref:Helix-turn-helix domain-containing protein n=2 Tax=Bacteroides xylanisolvens TaxID=371601 RepID=A0A7J5PYE6_9BACE|nr:helix-turn-helix domain-containing protein [Bacteroides xylanisolvens]
MICPKGRRCAVKNNPEYSDLGGDLVTKDNPRMVQLFRSIEKVFIRLELMAKNYKPVLNGERYLTDKEVSQRLKISRRTLQDYRNEGKIPYCQIGGKILYRESDLQKMLDESYREAYK